MSIVKPFLHGDVADPSEFSDGVDAERFYDFRNRRFAVVAPETTVASHDDIWVLRRQMRGRCQTGAPGKHPDPPRNVFATDPRLNQPLRHRKSRKHGEGEMDALERRRLTSDALLRQLRCRNCGRGPSTRGREVPLRLDRLVAG